MILVSVAISIACGILLALEYGYLVLLVSVPIAVVGLSVKYLFGRTLTESKSRAELLGRHVEELSHYIADQERMGKVLQKSEEQFRSSFDNASIGMALVAPSGKAFKVNRSLCDILGFDTEQLLTIPFHDMLNENDREIFALNLGKLLSHKETSCQMEMSVNGFADKLIWLMASISVVHDGTNGTSHFIFQLQDITDRKRAEARLIHDALHDALTGLPNRVLFLDRLNVAFKRAKRHFESNFAVLYFDFDRFKLVNDSFGHLVGDKLLVSIADRLRSILRSSDTVARLGGDEFVMLVEEISEVGDATVFVDRVREEMSKPFDLDGQLIYITVSTGIAGWSRKYERPEYLLRDADTALYQAKRLGRDRYEIFDEQMHHKALQSLQLANDLHRALEQSEMRVYYQPIVLLESGDLVGFEALIRWQHSIRGLVSPAEFIPHAEETGLIIPLGEWILRESCRQLKAWQLRSDEYSNLWISVNVSSKQFLNTDMVSLVADVLEKTGLSPICLKLEITESAMIENLDHVINVMNDLKKLGVQLSIDDFGTGYSSLSNLHSLPLSSLKIDRAFVNQMNEGGESGEIVRTIITLAQSLGLAIIAEGVETSDQKTQLQGLHCQFGQGYYFARPLDVDGIEELMSNSIKDLHASYPLPQTTPVTTANVD